MTPDLFVTGTGTGVGKTVLSALLVAALERCYWKPIQTGACEGTDREAVLRWAEADPVRAYPESYVFLPPVSPHLAAEQAGTSIELRRIVRPESSVPLIMEGAGGVMVPINANALMLDLMAHLGAPIVVAAATALGTINHTLLTVAAIRQARLDLRGVVMIGEENADNRRSIEKFGSVSVIGAIPPLNPIHRNALRAVFQEKFDKAAFA